MIQFLKAFIYKLTVTISEKKSDGGVNSTKCLNRSFKHLGLEKLCVSPCHFVFSVKSVYHLNMTCIISTFATFLLIGYGIVVSSKWIVKTIQNNLENILRTSYNIYNLPETIYQKIRVRVNRDPW